MDNDYLILVYDSHYHIYSTHYCGCQSLQDPGGLVSSVMINECWERIQKDKNRT